MESLTLLRRRYPISYDGEVVMPHALIVDDSAATLSALVELVSAEGFTTSAALADGQ